MGVFNAWLAENQPGFLARLGRRIRGEHLPPQMTPDEEEAYNKLRATGVGHDEALKLSFKRGGTPLRTAGMRPKPMSLGHKQNFERTHFSDRQQ